MDISLIMIDEIGWGNFIFGPQYIVGNNFKMIPVYIGNDSITDQNDENIVGIYIDTINYDKINHDYEYIFINYPYIDGDIMNIVKEIYYDLQKVDNPEQMDRSHVHIGDEYEKDEENETPTIH